MVQAMKARKHFSEYFSVHTKINIAVVVVNSHFLGSRVSLLLIILTVFIAQASKRKRLSENVVCLLRFFFSCRVYFSVH